MINIGRQAVELWAGVPACCRATRQDDVLASSPCGRYREVSLLGKGRSNARTTLGPRVRHANGLLPVSLTRTSKEARTWSTEEGRTFLCAYRGLFGVAAQQ
ncbi:hypothetical protein RUM43_003933 [Polyplax serrata]|uniref:Uncharacterized protein n=1 Tax=Polyplax serrata TaxID=468196 RepID=A0AAN8Q773_POLSC